MSFAVGIDLGTTFSALATLNGMGRPETVANAQGERLTRSAIYFEEEPGGVVHVGTEAHNARGQAPSRGVKWIKREMGNPEYKFDAHGKSWTPPELSALILKKLRQDCSQQVGEIRDAVITVPAYFDETRRKATMDAGAIAGLNVLAIINEPTAAALFYAVTHTVSGRVLVYDFGGGTFDVSVLTIKGHEVTVAASEGNHRLGGADIDNAIIELWRTAFRDHTGEELLADGGKRAEYENFAEIDKHSLSTLTKVKRNLSNAAGRTFLFTLQRPEFEEAISSLIATTDMLTEVALDSAKCKPNDINHVLLVGGSTRIPLIRQRLEKLFGRPPETAVNVDEAVACGAAVYAGVRMLRENPASVPPGIALGLKDVKQTDVSNRSYGIICLADDEHTGERRSENDVLIHKNTPLPAKIQKTYYTVADNQTSIRFRVTECDHDATDIDEVRISYDQNVPIPGGRPHGQPIEIEYEYDINQRMRCQFLDQESGKTHVVKFLVGEMGAELLDVDHAKTEVNRVTVQ